MTNVEYEARVANMETAGNAPHTAAEWAEWHESEALFWAQQSDGWKEIRDFWKADMEENGVNSYNTESVEFAERQIAESAGYAVDEAIQARNCRDAA